MANAVKRYQGEEYFVDDYVPQNMNAGYSSLHENIIWIGMGLMLTSLTAWGTFILGLTTIVFADGTTASHSNGFLAKNAVNYADYASGWSFDGSVFMWAGPVVTLIVVIAGVAYISIDHHDYKAYREEFNTHH